MTNYLPASAIADGGFAYEFDDGVGSTACMPATALCIGGTTGVVSSDVWGAGVGFHLNQANSLSAPLGSYSASSTTGLTYQVSAMPAQGLRLQIDQGGVEYCHDVSSASGTVPWTDFNAKCWDDSGTFLSGGPDDTTQIAFIVPAGPVSASFNLCVVKVAFDTSAPPPPPPKDDKGTGTACASNSECASGACASWCTSVCASNTDCGINSYGGLTWCVEDNAGIDSCFPGCSTNADCAVYGSGISCKPATVTNGSSTTVCAG
jgi:hypothetical protein